MSELKSARTFTTDTYTVHVSHKAYLNMGAEGRSRGFSTFAYLRYKAYALVRTVDPTFDICGHDLARTVEIGLGNRAWEGLQLLAKDLGVPEETIGELIASFVMPAPPVRPQIVGGV